MYNELKKGIELEIIKCTYWNWKEHKQKETKKKKKNRKWSCYLVFSCDSIPSMWLVNVRCMCKCLTKLIIAT